MTAESAGYLIGRDADESQRLTQQHDLWTRILGYRIHPLIVEELTGKSENVKIADVGCGTGIWLIDISHQMKNSSWQFDGFDISGEQFPPNSPESAAATASSLNASNGTAAEGRDLSVLPQNVNLQVQDMRKPFPPEYHGRYDLVHARLLIAALDQHEWAEVVANLRSILKPGGWLQWEEIDTAPHMEILRSGPIPFPAVCMRQAIQNMVDGLFHKIGVATTRLLDAYHTAGMKDIEKDVVCSDRIPELRAEASLLQMHVIRNIGRKLLQLGAPGAKPAEELDKIYSGAHQEITQGAYINYYIQCAIGRL